MGSRRVPSGTFLSECSCQPFSLLSSGSHDHNGCSFLGHSSLAEHHHVWYVWKCAMIFGLDKIITFYPISCRTKGRRILGIKWRLWSRLIPKGSLKARAQHGWFNPGSPGLDFASSSSYQQIPKPTQNVKQLEIGAFGAENKPIHSRGQLTVEIARTNCHPPACSSISSSLLQ